MTSPNISCLLPKRNNGKFFPAALQSLASQSHKYSSIIICENHSNDGSLDATFAIAEEYNNIDVFVPEKPALTFGESCYELIRKRPVADYFHIASSDDLWHSSFISQALKALALSDNISAVFADRIMIDDESNIIGASGNLSLPSVIYQQAALDYFLKGCSYIYSGAIFRADVIASAKSFAISTGQAFDWALILEASRLGDVVYLSEPLFSYRVHSLSTGFVAKHDPSSLILDYLIEAGIKTRYDSIHARMSSITATTNANIHPALNSKAYKLKLYMHRFGIFKIVRAILGKDV